MNVKRYLKHVIQVLVLIPAIGPLMAAGGIDVSMQAIKVSLDPQGKEYFGSATHALPGEVIEYQVTYSNTDEAPVQKLQATLPIPEGMEYLPDTARPTQPGASLDGDSYAPIPLKRRIVLTNGKSAEQQVPYAEYRYLRWNLDILMGGASTMVSARVKLADK